MASGDKILATSTGNLHVRMLITVENHDVKTSIRQKATVLCKPLDLSLVLVYEILCVMLS